MIIGIVTSRYQVFRDFIRKYALDINQCRYINDYDKLRGIKFDRIIMTCGYGNINYLSRVYDGIDHNLIPGSNIEYIPCCDRLNPEI